MAVATVIVILLSCSISLQGQAKNVVVLEGARLIDGSGAAPRENAAVVIEGDHITAIGTAGKTHYPKGARVVDVRGRTIVPGLINSHGHLGVVLNTMQSANAYTRENVQSAAVQYEQYGVTSMIALGLNRDLVYELRDEQKKGTFPGATIFTAGRGIGVPGAAPPVPAAPDQVYRPATADEARAEVREMASHHVDIIKIWVDDVFGRFSKMQPEVYAAVIDEAHKQGVGVAAHVFYLEDAKRLVADGVDVLAHSVRDQKVDADLIAAMKSHGTFYVPTLTVDESFYVFAEHPEMMDNAFFTQSVSPELLKVFHSPEYKAKCENDANLAKNKAAHATAMQNLKILQDAGVKVAFGTDSGAFPARIPGWGEHRELEMMVDSGLTPMQALVAATRTSASLIHAGDRGTLEPGKRADLIVLAANPLDDIHNTRQIVAIWHGGHEVQPRVPAAKMSAAAQ
ncbi:MAG TPA: amidohydrolase family protein [Terracidiphilus sp.]|nr:amidohydrolase family protein [Terracidiphilus sp.]